MNGTICTSTIRDYAREIFWHFHRHARAEALLAMIFRRAKNLESFSSLLPRLNPNRKTLGVQDILVERITGSVSRSTDFDANFRPLKQHLRERWVQSYLNLQMDRWEPIRVYKAGDAYFVEDGHHRASVARSAGMVYIQAEVYEYTFKQEEVPSQPGKEKALRAEPLPCGREACLSQRVS